MKFVAKERKTIDAIRWTGSNLHELLAWANALDLNGGLLPPGFDYDRESAVTGSMQFYVEQINNEPEFELHAVTLHGPVEVEWGAWAAYGGSDVYPLDDGELRRLYDGEGEDRIVTPEQFVRYMRGVCAGTRERVNDAIVRDFVAGVIEPELRRVQIEGGDAT